MKFAPLHASLITMALIAIAAPAMAAETAAPAAAEASAPDQPAADPGQTPAPPPELPLEPQPELPPELQAEPQPEIQPEMQPPAAEETGQQVEPPVAEEPEEQAETPAAEEPKQQAETPPAEEPKEQAQPPQPEVDPALERQARALLADEVNVREMNRDDLRQRLAEMRALLGSEKLSPATREALRRKLAEEREVLRAEVRGEEAPPPPPGADAAAAKPAEGGDPAASKADVQVALRDRRAPGELEEEELVRRIDIYRDVVRNERYDAGEREAWRRMLERDRRHLRRQMLEEREARAERLRRGDFVLEIEIGNDYDPDDAFREDVFAAEADDEELERTIAAPPRRKVQRRYTLEEIARSPEARGAVARIEIDTVHFGFGEGFLREEEIDKLDRIASILEKILARNPDEVFLIEGHTDAVGTAGANLALSRQRAQAVKQALATYYVIPAENLRTVGLGERYLKIPTQQAEAENRRVSLARITPLVGRAD